MVNGGGSEVAAAEVAQVTAGPPGAASSPIEATSEAITNGRQNRFAVMVHPPCSLVISEAIDKPVRVTER